MLAARCNEHCNIALSSTNIKSILGNKGGDGEARERERERETHTGMGAGACTP